MAVYEYKAIDSKGKNISGIIDADNPKMARQKLRKLGIFPTDIKEETTAGKKVSGKAIATTDITRVWGSVKIVELAIMTRQLATLVGAGLPLARALTALSEQVENEILKKVLTQVRERVTEGSSFADALSNYPKIFSDLYVNMVRAGESSGALDIVLQRLADFTEGQMKLQNKIKATLAYPVIMIFLSFGIVTFLMTYVVPKITKIFEQMKQVLPLPTRILIQVSYFFSNYWWVLIIGVIILIISFRQFGKTKRGRELYDKIALKLPVFGKVIKKIAISRFAKTLSTLLAGGLPLLKAMSIVKAVVNNVILANAIEYVSNNVTEGASVAAPLKETKMFPPIVVHMISVGEQTGELEEMLAKLSEAYDNEVEATITSLTSIFEPIIIIFMGGVVGFIVLSILLPMLELTSGITK